MSKTIALAAALLFAATGCSPSMTYEARPLPPRPKSAAESCYQDHRMEVSRGSSEWSETTGGGYGYQTVTTHYQSGLTFYEGGKRLDTETALDKIGDKELARTYEQGTDEHAGAKKAYGIALPATMILEGAGLGVIGFGMYQMLSAPREDHDAADRAVTPILIGSSLVIAGGITAIVALVTRKGASAYDVRRELFVEQPLVPRLHDATLARNARVATECAFDGPVDVPFPSSQ